MSFFSKKNILLTTASLLAAGATLFGASSCSGKQEQSHKDLLRQIKKISLEKRPLKDRVCDAYFLIAQKNENYKGFVYLCTSGVPTCGYGSSIDTPARRCQIEFLDAQGNRLTQEQVEARFKEIYAARSNYKTGTDSKGRPVYNYKADTYKDKFALFITRESAERLCKSDIQSCYVSLQGNFQNAGMNFEKKPFCLMVGCMDLQYNTGNFRQKSWPTCFKLLILDTPEAFKKAAEETKRGQVSADRNRLVKSLFEAGAEEKQHARQNVPRLQQRRDIPRLDQRQNLRQHQRQGRGRGQ